MNATERRRTIISLIEEFLISLFRGTLVLFECWISRFGELFFTVAGLIDEWYESDSEVVITLIRNLNKVTAVSKQSSESYVLVAHTSRDIQH